MRLLLRDAPSDAARQLQKDSGHHAMHVEDLGMGGADDQQVAEFARAEGRAVVAVNVSDHAAERDLVLVCALKGNLPAGGAQASSLAKARNLRVASDGLATGESARTPSRRTRKTAGYPWWMASIARVVTKRSLRSRDTDVSYWRERPLAERLAMVEELRRRHHGWDADSRPELQRVLRIVARP